MVTTATPEPVAVGSRRRARWVHGPVLDVAMALCWVPFAAAGVALQDNTNQLAWFVSATLLLSFSHQPLTLALVYGDATNFRLRRRIFTWSPLIFAVAVFATRSISLATLAVVGGLWNAEHTLMQRYGITRIYGRKSGQDTGSTEKWMLFSWLGLAMVWAAADSRTPGRVERTGLGGNNKRGLDILTDLSPAARWALPVVALLALGFTARWIRDERHRGDAANPAKRFYIAATAALFITILVNPIAGFLGHVERNDIGARVEQKARGLVPHAGGGTGDDDVLAVVTEDGHVNLLLRVDRFIVVVDFAPSRWASCIAAGEANPGRLLRENPP